MPYKKQKHEILEESRKLNEEIMKHFMTDEEQRVKEDIVRLLIKNNHRKYAQRLWDLNLNLVSNDDEPGFVAAIMFDEATVFINDGFVKGGPAIFNQLDTVMRHELAHNLMMHQIRMMHVFKQQHANTDPEYAYNQIASSMSLHELLNWLEDFEISNERYSAADKKIAKDLKLNGETIHGLVTEDHRDSWIDLPLEDMFAELENELADVYDGLRNDPNWQPVKRKGGLGFDGLQYKSARMIYDYIKVDDPSNLNAYGISLEDIENNAGNFPKYPKPMQKAAQAFYDAFKNTNKDDPDDVAKIHKILEDIAATGPEDAITITHPDTGAKVGTLYTADYKAFIAAILKKIIEVPVKLPQSFVDAWTKVMEIVGPMGLSNPELDQVIMGIGGKVMSGDFDLDDLARLFNF